MSTKHFFADTTGVVALGLESLVARNTNLAADLANKVIWKKLHDSSKVSIISGGGAGHEPAWSGYVGDGMLAASVSGEVFASPSTKQIMAAISKVPSEAGIILCITNYTGDNLHFGLAREKATGLGFKIGMLRMSEDVGLGRKQTENTGRRGLAGNMFGEKSFEVEPYVYRPTDETSAQAVWFGVGKGLQIRRLHEDRPVRKRQLRDHRLVTRLLSYTRTNTS